MFPNLIQTTCAGGFKCDCSKVFTDAPLIRFQVFCAIHNATKKTGIFLNYILFVANWAKWGNVLMFVSIHVMFQRSCVCVCVFFHDHVFLVINNSKVPHIDMKVMPSSVTTESISGLNASNSNFNWKIMPQVCLLLTEGLTEKKTLNMLIYFNSILGLCSTFSVISLSTPAVYLDYTKGLLQTFLFAPNPVVLHN